MMSASRDGDRLLGFTLPGRSARGRVVRLDGSLGEILAAHAYPAPIARLLAEALAMTAIFGSLFRPDEGQVTLQAKGEGGPVSLLVADCRNGAIRGYAAQELDRRFPPSEALEGLFGPGRLVITLDQTSSAERYQGIVSLGSETLQQTAEGYFSSSEQIPTLVRLAAALGPDGRWTAGGFLIQALARKEHEGTRLHVDADHPDWAHVQALASTLRPEELTDPSLPLEDLLWRLFNEDEVRLVEEQRLVKGCRCSVEHIRQVLQQFPEDERADMRNADGKVAVDCEFCSKQFLLEI